MKVTAKDFGWQLIGLAVRTHQPGSALGIIQAVSPDGEQVYVVTGKGKRAGIWRKIWTIDARTEFGRRRLEEWIIKRNQAETAELEFPVIAIEEETRRKIRTDEL